MSRLTQDDVLTFLYKLSEVDELKVCWTETGMASLWAAAGAFVGGLFGGPLGIALGAAGGGGIGAATCKKYKTLPEILNEMSPGDKSRLLRKILDVLTSKEVLSTSALAALLTSSASPVKKEVLKELGKSIHSMLSVSLQS